MEHLIERLTPAWRSQTPRPLSGCGDRFAHLTSTECQRDLAAPLRIVPIMALWFATFSWNVGLLGILYAWWGRANEETRQEDNNLILCLSADCTASCGSRSALCK